MNSSDDPIIVEQIYNSSIHKVWNAITKLDQMKQWYFDNITSFSPVVGFETQFEVKVEDRTFTHLWKLTEVIPLQKIVYKWKYEEYPGDSSVTFELSELDNQTKLRLTHHVEESFPDDIPEFTRESGILGWNFLIKERLKEYLKNV